jgi:putative transposase
MALFAALNVSEGAIITIVSQSIVIRNSSGFWCAGTRPLPPALRSTWFHTITGPTSSQKRLADRPHYHVHFTPISSSWLNQIERWPISRANAFAVAHFTASAI